VKLADDFFEMLGYKLPYRVNVADFILDLASGDVSTPDGFGSQAFPIIVHLSLLACLNLLLLHVPTAEFIQEHER
jgi:hypothetical protein